MAKGPDNFRDPFREAGSAFDNALHHNARELGRTVARWAIGIGSVFTFIGLGTFAADQSTTDPLESAAAENPGGIADKVEDYGDMGEGLFAFMGLGLLTGGVLGLRVIADSERSAR